MTINHWLRGLFCAGALCAVPAVAMDSDGDGVDDAVDNCSQMANADQRDSNGDGFGNACDADLNNDLIINVVDLGILRSVFFSADQDADANGDGTVNVIDLGAMRTQFFGPPGPGPVTQGFTQRPYRVEADFDNNGLVDAASDIMYTPDGKLLQQLYMVSGDGTPDLFQFAPDVGFQSDITYHPSGELATIAQDNFTSGNDFFFEYGYDGDDVLTRVDDTVLSAAGSTIFQQYATFTYVDGLRVRDDVFQLGTNLLLLVRNTLYDANDLPDTAAWSSISPGMPTAN